MKTRRRRVRAYWETDDQGGSFVPYEELIADPELLAKVGARLRKQLLDVVRDAKSLDLPQTDRWWAAVAKSTRTART